MQSVQYLVKSKIPHIILQDVMKLDLHLIWLITAVVFLRWTFCWTLSILFRIYDCTKVNRSWLFMRIKNVPIGNRFSFCFRIVLQGKGETRRESSFTWFTSRPPPTYLSAVTSNSNSNWSVQDASPAPFPIQLMENERIGSLLSISTPAPRLKNMYIQ